MNMSGQAVKKGIDYYQLDLDHLLVIVDDITIPFGDVRYREKGGTYGHNGLKSIQTQLGTQEYQRIRMGVGERKEGSLEDHVLSSFTRRENENLPSLIEEAILLIEKWIDDRGKIKKDQNKGSV